MNELKKYFQAFVLLAILFLVAACQSTTPTQKKQRIGQKNNYPAGTRIQVEKRIVPVIKSVDGVQDISWQITRIANKKALYFQQTPFILLQSNQQRIVGSTGCNILSGRYNLQAKQGQLQLQATAGHLSCNNALAQEAELMDALQRVRYFSIQQKQIRLLDERQQVLILAERP